MIHSDSIECAKPLTREETAPRPPARRLPSLARLLRLAGALVLLASASVFLLQRWSSGDDLLRYATLFGLTAALTATAVVCTNALRESKAARTLLGLSLALVPVHFAVLGALLYSRFAVDSSPGELPAFGVWVAPSAPAALATAGAAILLLLPIVYVALRALAHRQAGSATLAVLGYNAALLVPWRNADATAIVVAVLIALILTLELTWVRRAPSLRTREGLLVRAVLIAPVCIAFLRAHLYEPTELLYGIATFGFGASIFLLSRRLARRRMAIAVVEALALVPAAAGWGLIVRGLGAEGSSLLIAASLPFAGVLILASLASAGDGAAYRRTAALVAITAAGANVVLYPAAAASFLCLAVAIATLAYGFYVEQRLVLLAGLAGGLIGLAYEVHYALELYSWSRWGGMAVLGLLTILAAALLERHQAAVVAWAGRIRRWEL